MLEDGGAEYTGDCFGSFSRNYMKNHARCVTLMKRTALHEFALTQASFLPLDCRNILHVPLHVWMCASYPVKSTLSNLTSSLVSLDIRVSSNRNTLEGP